MNTTENIDHLCGEYEIYHNPPEFWRYHGFEAYAWSEILFFSSGTIRLSKGKSSLSPVKSRYSNVKFTIKTIKAINNQKHEAFIVCSEIRPQECIFLSRASLIDIYKSELDWKNNFLHYFLWSFIKKILTCTPQLIFLRAEISCSKSRSSRMIKISIMSLRGRKRLKSAMSNRTISKTN